MKSSNKKTKVSKKELSRKISKNIREFKQRKTMSNGRKISSAKQAVAIAYSQVKPSKKKKKAGSKN